MATIVTYNEDRTQEIIDGTTVDGNVDTNGKLILERRIGTTFDAGAVIGPQGFQGPGTPPPGAQIMLYAGSVAPLGWLFCDGSAVSRVNFSELFTIIGTTYGPGDGTTTFNLPDFRGRIPVGRDATQTEFDTLGEQGGEKTHLLTIEELPSHTHTVLGYSGVDDKNMTGNVGRMQAADTYGQGNTAYDKPTVATGGGTAHNNLQPYTTINYIISTATKTNGMALVEGGGISAPRYYTSTDRGTTAERDAKYGVPATSAARVLLHNKFVTWYNTELGWKERYYAGSTESGLLGVGIVIGGTPGWYPISEGPYIDLNAPAQVDNFYNTFITGWNMYGRKGGASWFTMTGTDRINVLKHGRYDIQVYTTQYAALNGVAPDYSLQILDTDNATLVRGVGGGAFVKDANYNTRPHQEVYDQIILPNQKVAWKLQKGTMPSGDTTMQIHGGGTNVDRGRFRIKYVGPPVADLET
jgi:microcystin-dependent protein